MKKISILGLAMSLGITWGLLLMILGWASMAGWGVKLISVLSSVYLGYESSLIGGIVGFFWGLLDGFAVGAIIAFLYNRFVKE
jgi:hypothetical protein